MATSADVRQELAALADPVRAEQVSRYLQMIPGGYGEGDRAIGVIGPWLIDKDRSVLDRLAESNRVWDRRIAIMATLAFIKAGDFQWTFGLSDRLLRDPHDLVHKAVGWMLREVGNRDRAAEEEFLAGRYRVMPRVMLRYAIEKFEPQRRREYLSGAV